LTKEIKKKVEKEIRVVDNLRVTDNFAKGESCFIDAPSNSIKYGRVPEGMDTCRQAYYQLGKTIKAARDPQQIQDTIDAQPKSTIGKLFNKLRRQH